MSLERFFLKNKTILVTGASGGIGRQIAITITEAGGNVIITGRDEIKLNETFNLLLNKGNKMIPIELTKDSEIGKLIQFCPPLDGVIHSAGIADLYPTKFINKKKIDETFSINYFAPMLLMAGLFQAKKINNKASIVFISSFSSHSPFPSGALYTGSKAALENYSHVLAVEHAKTGLRSNCVAPALVKTEIYENTFQSNAALENIDKTAKEYEKVYLHGFGNPSDVADAILFLLSDASRWITGQTIILDGGYMLGMVSKVLKM
jgi:NAD(P)-dependent dehydrogenase (short-subunit alcohol dehydrogenase family)